MEDKTIQITDTTGRAKIFKWDGTSTNAALIISQWVVSTWCDVPCEYQQDFSVIYSE